MLPQNGHHDHGMARSRMMAEKPNRASEAGPADAPSTPQPTYESLGRLAMIKLCRERGILYEHCGKDDNAIRSLLLASTPSALVHAPSVDAPAASPTVLRCARPTSSDLSPFIPPPYDLAPSPEALMELFLHLERELSQSKSPADPYGAAFLRTYSAHAAKLRINKATGLDDFVVTGCIGKGSCSELFLASWSEVPTIPLALKVMQKDLVVADPVSVCFAEERTFLEVAASAWRHIEAGSAPADIVRHKAGINALTRLRHAFQDPSRLFLAVDFCPGGDLWNLLQKFERFSEATAKFYLAEIVQAVEAVHALGFVHRDLRPENVYLSARGHVALGDFGSCARLGPNGSVASDKLGVLFHTPYYLAPELVRSMQGSLSETCGVGVDWWSFGITMYEMLHGAVPFEVENGTPTQTYHLIANHEEHLQFGKNPFGDDEVQLSADAIDLMKKLLSPQANRLGNRGGPEIRSHPFFSDVDWSMVGKTKPPFVPELSSAFDTSLCDEDESVAIPISVNLPSSADGRSSPRRKTSTAGFLSKSMPFIGYNFKCPWIAADAVEAAEKTPVKQPSSRHNSRRSSISKHTLLKRASLTSVAPGPVLSSSPLPPLVPRDTVGVINADKHMSGGNSGAQLDNSGTRCNIIIKSSTSSIQAIEMKSPLKYVDAPEIDCCPLNTSFTAQSEEVDVSAPITATEVSPEVGITTSSDTTRKVHFNDEVIFLDAARHGEFELAVSLADAGRVPSLNLCTATGLTPLCLAASSGHFELTKWLGDHGAELDAQCNDGCTALHLAVLEEHESITRYLVGKGASTHILNVDGESPLDWVDEIPKYKAILSNSR